MEDCFLFCVIDVKLKHIKLRHVPLIDFNYHFANIKKISRRIYITTDKAMWNIQIA